MLQRVNFSLQDHNLVQSNYSFKRKKYTNKYRAGDQLESVIVLRTNATLQDWTTARDLERSKSDESVSNKFVSRQQKTQLAAGQATDVPPQVPNVGQSNFMSKSLLGKIPTSMTIINNNTNALQLSTVGALSNSLHSDDGKLTVAGTDEGNSQSASGQEPHKSMRVVYNKALEAVQATGHCRGFIKGVYTLDAGAGAPTIPRFGVFCIRWRRAGGKEENESKFIISGLDIAEPPLNIYCTIEEKMFVKMPMAFKVVLKNPTMHVLHLIATLSISKSDNFICSGHKQVS